MKQGTGRDYSGTAGGRKVEPRGHVVNVKAVSQIGSSLGNHATSDGHSMNHGVVSETLYEGKVGFEAPPDLARDVHPQGSQGKR